jgi:ATP synthase protein I
MSDEQLTPRERRQKQAKEFTQKIGLKELRRIKGKAHKGDTVWFGLGMIGVVGWSVAIPTLIGTAIGLWIDHVPDSGCYAGRTQRMALGQKSTGNHYPGR